jgi:hypothetical protein
MNTNDPTNLTIIVVFWFVAFSIGYWMGRKRGD